MCRIHDKKGALLGPVNVLIGTTILIGILLIATFLIISIFAASPQKTDATKDGSMNFMSMQSMKAYLETRVNVSVNGKGIEMQMSDLIMLVNIDRSYKEALEKSTASIFDKVYPQRYYVQFLQLAPNGVLNPIGLVESSPGIVQEAMEIYSHPIDNFGQLFDNAPSSSRIRPLEDYTEVILPGNILVRMSIDLKGK